MTDEQEYLRILAAVQEKHEAGAYAGCPELCLLLNRTPLLLQDNIALRNEAREARQRAALLEAGQQTFRLNT